VACRRLSTHFVWDNELQGLLHRHLALLITFLLSKDGHCRIVTRDSANSPTSLRTRTTNKDSWIISFNAPAPAIAFFAEWES
jgi:hypothetical protein